MLSNFVVLWLITTCTGVLKTICSCELLSNFVVLWLITTYYFIGVACYWLWIAFKFCSFVIDNNKTDNNEYNNTNCELLSNFVVLWLIITKAHSMMSPLSCELLSNFVVLWLITTAGIKHYMRRMLWIAFKFCSFVIDNNEKCSALLKNTVVNCFQIL